MPISSFFPVRLARVADAVSDSMASIYAGRFHLTRDEWRVLSALDGREEMQTRDVAERTSLDKVSLSRAASRLEERGLIRRTECQDDRRIKILRLTRTGRGTLAEVTRIVSEREAYLLEALTETERAALEGAMRKLAERAETLNEPENRSKCRPGCACTCAERAEALGIAFSLAS